MRKIIYLLLGILIFSSCENKQQKTIILSKASSNYVKWIESENIIVLDAYTIKNTDSNKPITIRWKLPLDAATTANTLSKLKVKSAINT